MKARRWAYTRQSTKPSSWSFEILSAATLRGSEDEFALPRRISGCTGAGELLGTRQSGLPDMRLADLCAHAELLQAACDDARLVIERDPDLQSERGAALRALLYPVPA